MLWPKSRLESDEPETPPAAAGMLAADQARSAALMHFTGAMILGVQLEEEDANVVWGIQLVDSAGRGQDVKIGATTGQILRVEPDGSQQEQHGGQGRSGSN
jgi:uncharacterized membrane protein YkoI